MSKIFLGYPIEFTKKLKIGSDIFVKFFESKDQFNKLVFSFDKRSIFSLYDLCKYRIAKSRNKKKGKLSIHYSPYRGKAMYYFYLGIFIRIELKFKFIWKIKETNLPVSLLSYEQNKYGVLVWVAEAKWETNEGISSVKIPLVKYGDGHEIKHLEIDAPPGTEITLIKKRFKSR